MSHSTLDRKKWINDTVVILPLMNLQINFNNNIYITFKYYTQDNIIMYVVYLNIIKYFYVSKYNIFCILSCNILLNLDNISAKL